MKYFHYFMPLFSFNSIYSLQRNLAQWAGAVEYIDCISAEGESSSNECSGYDTK